MKVLIFCLSLWLPLHSELIHSRSELADHTISVIIPCHSSHANLLLDSLYNLLHQSYQPDEVIVSLSGTEKLHKNILGIFIPRFKERLNLKVIEHEQELTASENRNIATAQATMDVLIYEDADDISHPRRLEIIKHFFDSYEIDVLYHAWHSYFDKPQVEGEIAKYRPRKQRRHHGHVSLSRAVAQNTPWIVNLRRPFAKDVALCRELLSKGVRIGCIPHQLVLWRTTHSASSACKNDLIERNARS
ncbi:MAG: glycosyltransferase [Simkaniaceae bacterium]|nr:glycosyltransferase [Simkaniaceae bacterium]